MIHFVSLSIDKKSRINSPCSDKTFPSLVNTRMIPNIYVTPFSSYPMRLFESFSKYNIFRLLCIYAKLAYNKEGKALLFLTVSNINHSSYKNKTEGKRLFLHHLNLYSLFLVFVLNDM